MGFTTGRFLPINLGMAYVAGFNLDANTKARRDSCR
jgi:hypothetical protein